MSLRVRVEFLSDWHVGSGAGGVDGTDRGVVKDHHGFPYVPAKTLTGVLRDSLETVVTGLGNGWSEWVDVVFGSQPSLGRGAVDRAPCPAAVSIRPAFMSDSLKTALDGDLQRSRLTHVKAGVAIDKKTGTALERHLNFFEVNRPVELVSHVEIDANIEQRATVVALLQAACAFTESIGGRRRKGLGRCRVVLEENGIPLSIEAEVALPIDAPPIPVRRTAATPSSSWVDDGSPLVPIDVVLTARTPLLVDTITVGNVVMSGDAINGATLLPHLHRWVETVGGDARALIAAGRAAALRAVPNIDNARSLPASFALQRPKEGVSNVWRNSSVSSGSADEIVTKQVRTGWLSGSGPNFRFLPSVPRVAVTHNVVDDEMQKPTSDVGGLFTYVALQAGSSFHARFLVPESLSSKVVGVVESEGSIRVGRSKKDDYGWLDVVVVAPTQFPFAAASDTIRVWAVSDVLPLNETSVDGWVSDVCRAAGVDSSLVSIDSDLTRVRYSRVESWQATWGFPRPTLTTISAGSCLVLRTAEPLAVEALRALTGRCVGGRTAEGFGEISVDHPLLARAEVTVNTEVIRPAAMNDSLRDLTESEQRFVEAVQRATARQRIRTAALSARAKGTGPTAFGSLLKVKSSQLSRLRSWSQFLEEPLNSAGMAQLDHDTRQWDKEPRTDVKKLLGDSGWVWAVLEIDDADRDPSFWGEAVRSLIEVVFREVTRGNS